MTVRPKVYEDGRNGCLPYEDDFETFAYAKGRQNRVHLWVDGDGRIQAERIGGERERYRIMLPES